MSNKPYKPEWPGECWAAFWTMVLLVAGGAASFALHSHAGIILAVPAKWCVTGGFGLLSLGCLAYYFYAAKTHLQEENARLGEDKPWLRDRNDSLIEPTATRGWNTRTLTESVDRQQEVASRFRENLHVPLDRRPGKMMN